jgi:hypothetical protein
VCTVRGMLKYLEFPLVILLLVMGVLIYVRMSNRAQIRRGELRRGELAEETLAAIRREVAIQRSAGYDPLPIESLLYDHDQAVKKAVRKKEIAE